MNYTFYEKQPDKQGVISNLHGFMHRYLDGGFRSKWSGFWAPPYKYLDYFSFKVNGVWLNSETLKGIEYGEEMVFHHETDSLEIEEKITAPDDLPGIRVELEIKNKTDEMKALHTVLETGVDIRHRSEDVPEQDYEVKREKDDRLLISRDDRKLVIDVSEASAFEGNSYTKEHHPGEKQVCLIPERPVFRREIHGEDTEKITVEFKTSDSAFGSLEDLEQGLDHELGRTFDACITSLENLIYNRNGKGIIAGHPWFQNYWARDSFWSILGLIDAGYFETATEILENFSEKKIPGKIDTGKDERDDLDRADTAPLFIIASEKLRKYYGLSEEIEKARENCMARLELEENTVKHSPDGTWMDTLKREKAVDIQSLWLEAADIMQDGRRDRLEEGLNEFRKDGLMRDELEGGHNTINPAVPLMFGQLEGKNAETQLEKINGEFTSRYGARTRSVTDPGYNASGYHTGSVWGLTTCWAAAANLEYGKDREGLNLLEKLSEFLDRDQPGALPEVVDAETGELLGCPEQAWSAGLLVHVVDSYLLGIEVEEDSVKIDPVDGVNCVRRGKKIRGEKIDLKVEDGETEILNNPDLDLRL